jgi:hypothetical protein
VDAVLALHQEGAVETGVIEKVVGFGVFVTLTSGLAGLLHNSEIAADTDFAVGDVVDVTILSVDHNRQRIGLATHPRLPPGSPRRVLDPDLTPPKAMHELPTVDPSETSDVAGFMRRLLQTIEEPVSMAVLADHIRSQFGPALYDNWLGYAGFKSMLQGLIPEAVIDADPSGTVYPLNS